MTKFKVGDKVRLVKARENHKAYKEPGFSNMWMPEMTIRVKSKDEGIIQDITDAGIYIVGWMYGYPPDSFELVEPPIDWSKPVQTRDGTLVSILSRKGRGIFPVIGYIGDATEVDTWTAEGKYRRIASQPEDLMNVPEKPMQKEVWFNVFKRKDLMDVGVCFHSKQKADESPSAGHRVGCIKVVLTEGQFDN